MRPLRIDDLRALAEPRQWPSISLYMPTRRTGRNTRDDPVRLRRALTIAQGRMADAGYPKHLADQVLAPATELIRSGDFWRHQSDGLAVFLAPGVFQYFRMPLQFRDDIVVSDYFAIKQLIPCSQTTNSSVSGQPKPRDRGTPDGESQVH